MRQPGRHLLSSSAIHRSVGIRHQQGCTALSEPCGKLCFCVRGITHDKRYATSSKLLPLAPRELRMATQNNERRPGQGAMVGCRATADGVVIVLRQTPRADQEDGNIDLQRSLEDRLQVIVGLGVDDDGGCAALVCTYQRRAKPPAGG